MGDTTISGYNVWEVQSAFQKAIRRNQPRLALRWAFEMETAGWFAAMVTRTKVICFEDVGIGDPVAVQHALSAINFAAELYAKKNHGWRLGVSNAVLALCKAQKSRSGDEIIAVVIDDIEKKVRPPIPDEALDKHTHRGKKMGRGYAHFVDEGSKLEPAPTHTEFKAEAEAVWRSWDNKHPAGGSDNEPPPQTKMF